ncbi:12771_t:CDS:1, partial [Gigaspora rosea]
ISSFVKTKAITSSVKSKAISNSVVTTTDNLSKLESYDFTIPVNNTIEFEEKDKWEFTEEDYS